MVLRTPLLEAWTWDFRLRTLDSRPKTPNVRVPHFGLWTLAWAESGRFFRGANRAVLPEPTDEANRCNLRHLTPTALQKAQYVGFSESAQTL
jgi:hypothetical protein